MAASETPKRLRERGTALWEKMGLELNTPEGVIGEEACRVADRIDQLFDMMEGGDDEAIIREITLKVGDVFPAAYDGGDAHFHLKLTGLQSEMRAQQALLRQLALSAMGLKKYMDPDAPAQGAATESEPPPAKAGRPTVEEGNALSEFTMRRQQREQSA